MQRPGNTGVGRVGWRGGEGGKSACFCEGVCSIVFLMLLMQLVTFHSASTNSSYFNHIVTGQPWTSDGGHWRVVNMWEFVKGRQVGVRFEDHLMTGCSISWHHHISSRHKYTSMIGIINLQFRVEAETCKLKLWGTDTAPGRIKEIELTFLVKTGKASWHQIMLPYRQNSLGKMPTVTALSCQHSKNTKKAPPWRAISHDAHTVSLFFHTQMHVQCAENWSITLPGVSLVTIHSSVQNNVLGVSLSIYLAMKRKGVPDHATFSPLLKNADPSIHIRVQVVTPTFTLIKTR